MPGLLSKLSLTGPNRLPMLWAIFKRHGHARVLYKSANKTTWMRGKDHMHFYFLIGILGWGGIAIYYNTFYGPCQLIDTPEGYEPRYWEYDTSPLKQTMCWLFSDSPQKYHERFLGQFYHLMVHNQWQREEIRARRLIYERQDYKAWYYVPYRAKWIEWSHWEFEAFKRTMPAFMQSPS